MNMCLNARIKGRVTEGVKGSVKRTLQVMRDDI